MKLKIEVNGGTPELDENVKMIRQGLKEKNGYCPCMIELNEDNKCMCKPFREQQEEGPCHCGLYRKVRVEA